jgi:predicted oxidoreductase
MRIVDDPSEGIRTLRRTVELGVTLIDTADIYGAGRSEELIADALHPYPQRPGERAGVDRPTQREGARDGGLRAER